MPPTSLFSEDLVIRLFTAGCKTPPPSAAGSEAINNQMIPNQPLAVSSGGVTRMSRIETRIGPCPARLSSTFDWLYHGTGRRGVSDVPIRPMARVETPKI